ncbi:unnamed protein product [Nesidiocoris tenuis]|uniref:TNase-like domain-containing protein n=1 Tax=Nesidiocoris tenuis TaxID=355587 RepID=A0A6H5GF13_9HEMI|nr:unnamed protein product [Nesidiocoris tenuis]
MMNFVDKLEHKPVKAVVEHVRDGSTIRAFLLPDFYYVTLMMSGIRCPAQKLNNDGQLDPNVPEFAEEARLFTEKRLLHQDVEIVLDSINNNNFLGSVIHPISNSEYVGTVVEVINGDALVVKKPDGTTQKIFLASIRAPRDQSVRQDQDEKPAEQRRVKRPLYDIPWMFEAREFLRKKLIGKKVNVKVDYTQPARDNFPEKQCCTVLINNTNVAEAMLAKGLCTLIYHKQTDDQRASNYDVLLAAENKAIKNNKGVHSKKEFPTLRVNDICGHYIDKEETTGEVIEVDDKISERKMEFKEVLVVETNELSFWCQYAAQGQKLNALQAKLSQEMAANPPLAGSFTPKKARGCQTGNPAVPDRRPGPSSAAEFRIRGQGYQLCDAPRSGQERRHRQIAGQRGLPARTEAAREKTRGSGQSISRGREHGQVQTRRDVGLRRRQGRRRQGVRHGPLIVFITLKKLPTIGIF